MSETTRSFREQIFGVLRSPSTGFPQIEEDDLRKGIIIIFIIGLLSSWAGVVYLSKTEFDLSSMVQRGSSGMGRGGFFSGGSQSTPDIDPDALRGTMMPFLAIGSIVGAFTRWLIPSVLILITAKILIGDGSTRRMLTMTAFASLPQLAQQLLRVADAYTISSIDLTALRTPLFPSTGLILKAMNQGVKVFNIFGLLTLALTVYAVSANYGSPKRRALTVSVSAYLAYVLLKVFLPI
ncbi:YIP1 family protein [Candidatus Bathyarchaeota archaeon]|nr:YIP1 family protein [Candidatus Bathyarchaeota archaeon]